MLILVFRGSSICCRLGRGGLEHLVCTPSRWGSSPREDHPADALRMLEVLNQDYIRTARAKGVSGAPVVWKQRVQECPRSRSSRSSGSSWARAGRIRHHRDDLCVARRRPALRASDLQPRHPVVQAAVSCSRRRCVLVNLIVDLLYTYLDPGSGCDDAADPALNAPPLRHRGRLVREVAKPTREWSSSVNASRAAVPRCSACRGGDGHRDGAGRPLALAVRPAGQDIGNRLKPPGWRAPLEPSTRSGPITSTRSARPRHLRSSAALLVRVRRGADFRRARHDHRHLGGYFGGRVDDVLMRRPTSSSRSRSSSSPSPSSASSDRACRPITSSSACRAGSCTRAWSGRPC